MAKTKKNIFFIYEFGGDPDSDIFHKLKDSIDSKKYNVISNYYAQYSPKEALIDLNNYVKTEKIDVVIGLELGGWLATLLNNRKIKKILVNPTFNPLIEFDKEEGGFPEYIMNFYKEYIDKLDINEYNYSNTNILLTDKIDNEYDEIDTDNIIYIENPNNIFDSISSLI